MMDALGRLSAVIRQRAAEQHVGAKAENFSTFPLLSRLSEDLDGHYDKAQSNSIPSWEKRHQAIRKFRKALSLTRIEWRMVFAGLADEVDEHIPILDDDEAFGRVHREVDDRIDNELLSAKDWKALCHSYFFYDADALHTSGNWRTLGQDISRCFPSLKAAQKRPREWIRVFDLHAELFTQAAAKHLGDQMIAGQMDDLAILQTVAQINNESWLWRRIFGVILKRIVSMDDAEFLGHLPRLIELSSQNHKYTNDILSACLTRYYLASCREQPSALLKQATLESWGSPQMRSKQNRWLVHVDADVCAMVVGWFAREDLEHFFNLLKGEAEVDQSRLFYWLRFANQMSYTRIVMGSDAWNARGRDYVDFREKNKGRLSRLSGGPGSNNAVIMQIGDYLFVEFSGTGHACYVYKNERAPFKPDKSVLDLNTELRQRGLELKRMLHSPRPNSANRVEGWLHKFDAELRELGITPRDGRVASSQLSVTASFDSRLIKAFEGSPHKIFDMRSKGGAYQVQLQHADPSALTLLEQLGFTAVTNQPLRFWRK